jgi:DNA-binding transcriptional LysR family regulator
MELKHLRHFVAVVDCGTLSAATAVLHITQPALTRSIKTLEHQLDAELLERRARGVVPTEAGARLYRQAKTILNHAARTAEDIRATAKGERGSLSVGVAAMFSGDVMAAVLNRLGRDVPELRVNVTEGYFEELINGLKTSAIEVLVTNFPPGPSEPDLTYEPLIKVQTHFLAGADHPLAKLKDVGIADLAQARMALVRQTHVQVLVAELFAAKNVGLTPPAIETNALPLLRSLVLSGNYVSLLPAHLLEDDMKAGRIVTLPVPGTPFDRSAGLIMRDLEVQRPAVLRFSDTVRHALSNWPDIKT